MKRLQALLGGIAVITCLVATVESCGSSDGGPVAPSGPTFTISGTVTAYRGGPLGGASVLAEAFGNGSAKQTTTQTDSQGRYSLSSLSAGMVSLAVWKDAYMGAWKNNISPENSTANFILQPSVTPLNPDGASLAGIIRGDELMAGDDVLFGGLCARTACKWIAFAGFTGRDRQVEVRLRWTDPARQLALYKSRQDPDSIFISIQPADRYSGPSEVLATVSVNGYSDAIAVAFEQSAGGPPGPFDSQPFELTVQPKQ